jgi:uncharacterized protein (TIGR02757 family)
MKDYRETPKSNLSRFLNGVHKDFHVAKFLYSDPIEFIYRYQDPLEQEAVALLAALLAYGKVGQIRKSVEEALLRISKIAPSPKIFVKSLDSAVFKKKAHEAFQGFVHRFNKDSDPVILFELLNLSWSKYGSLGAHFNQYLKPSDSNIETALSQLIKDWRNSLPPQTPKSFHYLLTSPEDGSCCKRWCMFLRWMGRKDEIDPGLWTHFLKSNQLIMPLDTHTGRISQYLGLTLRKSLNWKASVEITAALKLVDPADPTRYDFALSRLGILELCQRSYREEICKKCQLLPVCQYAQKKVSQSVLRSMPR